MSTSIDGGGCGCGDRQCPHNTSLFPNPAEATETHSEALYIASWDETFMTIAETIAKRSKDPTTQVGAVIVSTDKKILGVGYNGMPNGDDSFPWTRPEKYQFVIHAEENAIINMGRNLPDAKGGTIYCNYYPCFKCVRLLVQTGIKEVVFSLDGRHRDKDAEMTLQKCGIRVRQFSSVEYIEPKKRGFWSRLFT